MVVQKVENLVCWLEMMKVVMWVDWLVEQMELLLAIAKVCMKVELLVIDLADKWVD